MEDGDYYDAKTVAKGIAPLLEGWQMEGSVHNVARRDGIGSLILDARLQSDTSPIITFKELEEGLWSYWYP